MGTCYSQRILNHPKQKKEVNLNDFMKCYLIGKGGYSKVWKCVHKKSHHEYAMKEMSKVKLFEKRSIVDVNTEMKILSTLSNSFLINMVYAFQTEEYVYIITEFFGNGDLRNFITNTHKQLAEYEVKFIVCNIISGLYYLRAQRIVHRDLKPENLLFDKDGYLHIADFGIAKKLTQEANGRTVIETSGTPGYMSPESLLAKPQNFLSDYFSLGVICYELIFGKRPFGGKTKREIRENILRKNVSLTIDDLPCSITFDKPKELCDFMNRLLKRKQYERLGANGLEEIMNHEWIKDFDWNSLIDRKMKSPFEKIISSSERDTLSNYYLSYCNTNENLSDYNLLLKKINNMKLFHDFYFLSKL